MASASQNQAVFALYRAFLRQTRKLPQLYLRQFWRIKGSDDVRAIVETDILAIRDRKVKRMSKDLRKLEAANKQNVHAFNHVLDVAYGRKGKLKRELMEPLLTDPTAPVPPRIIPAVESSRPPVYSKELLVLLASSASRVGRVPSKAFVDSPPKLPARANPNSEEARLLGPLSKRRETNARWRYFVEESHKVLPPLQVVVEHDPASHGVALDDLRRVGIRSLPMQGLHIFEDVERLAAPSPQRVPSKISDHSSASTEPHTPRWLRRRYQSLLNHLPVLTCKTPTKNPRYSVSLSPNRQTRTATVVDADLSDLEWLEQGLKELEQGPEEDPPPALDDVVLD